MLVLLAALSAGCLHAASAEGDCEFKKGGYRLEWRPTGDSIRFTLELQPSGSLASYWTGVAFGKSMSSLDFILITGDGASVDVNDAHTDSYGPPVVDEQQDITVVSKGYEGGKLRVVFERKLDTGDADNDAVIDPNSFMLQLPYAESPLDGTTVRKHTSTPMPYVASGTCPQQEGQQPAGQGAHGEPEPQPESALGPGHSAGDGHDHGGHSEPEPGVEPEAEPAPRARTPSKSAGSASEPEPDSATSVAPGYLCALAGSLLVLVRYV